MSNDADDFQNLLLAGQPEEIDRLNAAFYGKFPYPWRPQKFELCLDNDFERKLLCQSLGDWDHRSIPSQPNIWVAGCGTNQAVITALNFPDAFVIGSDLSQPSLDLSQRTAAELSIQNLELRRESINDVTYCEKFDYILCTGVIHHNADPESTLNKLRLALKPTGVLELMVYNRFHRVFTSSFQKAMRILSGSNEPGSSLETLLTKSLMDDIPYDCLMKKFLGGLGDAPSAAIADALMQPIEHSYTVASLQKLANNCGLKLFQPSFNIFDKSSGRFRWNINFTNETLKSRYFRLDDCQRWQVSNLLLCETSPMLWFYMKRNDVKSICPSEMKICDTFLDTTFEKSRVLRRRYELNSDGVYVRRTEQVEYPPPPRAGLLAKVVNVANGRISMREILRTLGIPTSFPEVNEIRLQSTTTVSPYLLALR